VSHAHGEHHHELPTFAVAAFAFGAAVLAVEGFA
jgi:hypothetical protein